ncbi:MAG: hypothetical protein ACK5OX_15700 [Desertimonas sp.]
MLDWNPNDPDTVKVHYDVSGWSIDQRAELSEALADEDLAHVWADDELVVPEALESEVDTMFERLESALGPFAIPLDHDDEGIEYGLDEWPPADRATLTGALVHHQIPHRWESTLLIVASDAEADVDDLLDAVEQGTYEGEDGAVGGGVAPEDALSTMFAAADRLAKDPEDETGRSELRELRERLHPAEPAYGLSVAAWTKAVETADALIAALDDPSEQSASAVIGAAQDLRSRVRQYV